MKPTPRHRSVLRATVERYGRWYAGFRHRSKYEKTAAPALVEACLHLVGVLPCGLEGVARFPKDPEGTGRAALCYHPLSEHPSVAIEEATQSEPYRRRKPLAQDASSNFARSKLKLCRGC